MDVMGGIGEDSGSLVLTATLAMSFIAGAWTVADDNLHLRMLTEAGQGPARDLSMPLSMFGGNGGADAVLERCRQSDCEWAAPSILAIQQAITDGVIPRPGKGAMVLLQSDFRWMPNSAGFMFRRRRPWTPFASLYGCPSDRLRESRACDAAVTRLAGMSGVRTAMTALCAPPGGSMLQLRFQPQLLCQPLELPAGIVIVGARTRLARRPRESGWSRPAPARRWAGR